MKTTTRMSRFGVSRPDPGAQINRLVVELAERLRQYGVQQKQMAIECRVTAGHFSRVLTGERPASVELVNRLQLVERKRLEELLADMEVVKVLGRDNIDEEAKRNIRRATVAALSGHSESAELPPGVAAAIVRVGESFVITLKDSRVSEMNNAVLFSELAAMRRRSSSPSGARKAADNEWRFSSPAAS
jgi:transcriptional regulator with XRE-family HTH domain